MVVVVTVVDVVCKVVLVGEDVALVVEMVVEGVVVVIVVVVVDDCGVVDVVVLAAVVVLGLTVTQRRISLPSSMVSGQAHVYLGEWSVI